MQLKFIPILAGAIALTLTTGGFAVQAAPAHSPSLQAQAKEPRGLERLGLTEEQKAKMTEIRSNTRSQIEAVLTPAQKEQLQTAMQSGQKRRETMAALNLTPEQQNQMRQIRESAKSQFEAVLTPEQRQQLEQLHQNKRMNRQQNNG